MPDYAEPGNGNVLRERQTHLERDVATLTAKVDRVVDTVTSIDKQLAVAIERWGSTDDTLVRVTAQQDTLRKDVDALTAVRWNAQGIWTGVAKTAGGVLAGGGLLLGLLKVLPAITSAFAAAGKGG